jgi:hypothetical protein
MNKRNSKERVRHIAIDPDPKGNLKSLGGADHDDWNDWLALTTSLALPIDQTDETAATKATTAVYSAMIDLKPADPLEGILCSQLMVVHQAALAMYRRAWAQPPEYLEARLKYLAHGDKAMRTAAMLTERIDQHRGRAQQQITVKHVTVNADQAVVTETVVAGKLTNNSEPSPVQLPAVTDQLMASINDVNRPEAARRGTKQK